MAINLCIFNKLSPRSFFSYLQLRKWNNLQNSFLFFLILLFSLLCKSNFNAVRRSTYVDKKKLPFNYFMIYAEKKLNGNFLVMFQCSPKVSSRESFIFQFVIFFLMFPIYIHKFILIVYKLYFSFNRWSFIPVLCGWALKSSSYWVSLVWEV